MVLLLRYSALRPFPDLCVFAEATHVQPLFSLSSRPTSMSKNTLVWRSKAIFLCSASQRVGRRLTPNIFKTVRSVGCRRLCHTTRAASVGEVGTFTHTSGYMLTERALVYSTAPPTHICLFIVRPRQALESSITVAAKEH